MEKSIVVINGIIVYEFSDFGEACDCAQTYEAMEYDTEIMLYSGNNLIGKY